MVRKHARRCTTSQDATNTVIKKQSRKKFAHSRCYLQQQRGNRQNAKLEWAIFRPPVLSAVQCARVVAYCCVQEGRQKVIILKLMNVSSQRICSSCLCVRAWNAPMQSGRGVCLEKRHSFHHGGDRDRQSKHGARSMTPRHRRHCAARLSLIFFLNR